MGLLFNVHDVEVDIFWNMKTLLGTLIKIKSIVVDDAINIDNEHDK